MFLRTRLLLAGTFVVLVSLVVTAGCVTSSGGGGVGVLGGGGSANPTIVKLDGREIKADELLRSPVFRQTLRQWAMIEHIKQEAAAANITADQVKVKEQLEKQKSEMAAYGQDFNKLLEEQGMTEADVIEMMSFSDLSEQLAKKKAGEVSDQDLNKLWEERQETYKANYASENFLTDAQKKELKLADIKDWVKDQVVQERAMAQQQIMFETARKSLKLELPPLGNADAQKPVIELIIGKIEEEPQPASPDSAATPDENSSAENVEDASAGSADGADQEAPSEAAGADGSAGASPTE